MPKTIQTREEIRHDYFTLTRSTSFRRVDDDAFQGQSHQAVGDKPEAADDDESSGGGLTFLGLKLPELPRLSLPSFFGGGSGAKEKKDDDLDEAASSNVSNNNNKEQKKKQAK